jgi:hypothetical protein
LGVEATGICCAVGGIRYSPLTENEKQALAFDEIAPSDDGMDYDKWEAMRAVKTAAMLKLTTFARSGCERYGFGSSYDLSDARLHSSAPQSFTGCAS